MTNSVFPGRYRVMRAAGEILTYRRVACEAGGAFEIGDVPAGPYYIVAFDAAFDPAGPTGLPAADLPGAVVPLASEVEVGSKSVATVNLHLNKWPW